MSALQVQPAYLWDCSQNQREDVSQKLSRKKDKNKRKTRILTEIKHNQENRLFHDGLEPSQKEPVYFAFRIISLST